ncbi:hypothetical protein QWY77_01920 [Thalassotalea ponticola]|uniref:hypothetical protein n=1 Tax=Thalassotalea ponticola TaxID=1523392 RepID=UPI0025B29985|nr:hypothetical protein [Thalassotalea ponticola]MDN3651541.1 hypothetical protein [Thalassotalea ponticola]
MIASIDISLYPLAMQTYEAEIWQFIDRLRSVDGLKVVTNGLSTQVFGDYDLATTHVLEAIKQVHQRTGSAVFVVKLLAGEVAFERPHRDVG